MTLFLCIISLLMTLNKSLDTAIWPIFPAGFQLCHPLFRGLVDHTTAINASPTPSKHMIAASVSNHNLITLKQSGWQQIARVSTMILTLPSISSLQWVHTDGPIILQYRRRQMFLKTYKTNIYDYLSNSTNHF